MIGHGPEVLISAGLVGGRRLTSWPAVADDVRNAGGQWEDAPVVRDGTWISSRGPHDLLAFEKAMVELFYELAPRGLVLPQRRLRWVGQLTRAAFVGCGLAGARMALARRRSAVLARSRRREVLAGAVQGLARVRTARVHRARVISGWPRLLALAGAIGLGAVLARGARASRQGTGSQ